MTKSVQWPMIQLRVSYYHAFVGAKFMPCVLTWNIFLFIYSIYGVNTPKENANILIHSNNSCHFHNARSGLLLVLPNLNSRHKYWKTNISSGKKALFIWMHVNIIKLLFFQVAAVSYYYSIIYRQKLDNPKAEQIKFYHDGIPSLPLKIENLV